MTVAEDVVAIPSFSGLPGPCNRQRTRYSSAPSTSFQSADTSSEPAVVDTCRPVGLAGGSGSGVGVDVGSAVGVGVEVGVAVGVDVEVGVAVGVDVGVGVDVAVGVDVGVAVGVGVDVASGIGATANLRADPDPQPASLHPSTRTTHSP